MKKKLKKQTQQQLQEEEDRPEGQEDTQVTPSTDSVPTQPGMS